jgi:two-component system LytT family response regulator
MNLRTIMVDDEPPARERLRELLREHEDVEIAGEAGGAAEAVRLVRELRPRLMFLDVQMPGDDGFEVLRRLDPAERPLVVFITAFEQYAFAAFRANAGQYLLKPVIREELRMAMARVRQIASSDADAGESAAVAALLQNVEKFKEASRKVMVRTADRTLLFDVDQIDWIDAARNYVRLHIGPNRYLIRESMAGIEERLDPKRFVRIHRSTIVNIERIREFHPYSHGDFTIRLLDGTSLMLSRAYRDRFEFLLGSL